MHTARPYLFFLLLAALGVASLTFGLLAQGAETLLRAFLIAINITAFGLCGLDKAFARSQSLRVPEAVLYLLALLGGSPGTFLGIYLFRHKTRKAAFQFALLGIVTAQLLLLRIFGISL